VYRDCIVFLNGYRTGRHESGCSSFLFDITDAANCGGENVLAVPVDASKFEGWIYVNGPFHAGQAGGVGGGEDFAGGLGSINVAVLSRRQNSFLVEW
jgi:hypothetical protein